MSLFGSVLGRRLGVLGLLALCLGGTKAMAANENTLRDRYLISEAVSEYAYLWDDKDADAFAQLFTSDSTIEWRFGDGSKSKAVSGREQILDYAKNAMADRIGEKQSRHHFSNLVFREISSERAVTQHMMLVTHQIPGGNLELVSTGTYQIEWMLVDGKWLIKKRTLYLDG